MKKHRSALFAVCIAAVCFAGSLSRPFTVVTTSHAAPAQPITLLVARTVSTASGGLVFRSFSGSIEIANLTSDKAVSVHYSLDGSSWRDASATYKNSGSVRREVWTFDVSLPTLMVSDGASPAGSTIVFAVNTTQAGTKYWDNNGFADYLVGTSGTGTHPETLVLGSANVELSGARGFINGWPAYVNTKFLNVVVKNRAHTKSVMVRTTMDGWKTWHDSPLSFTATRSDGTELWTSSGSVGLAVKDLDFAIKYEVDGQVFWDNNDGQNYRLTMPGILYEDPLP